MATVITKDGDSIITTVDGVITKTQSIRREDGVTSVIDPDGTNLKIDLAYVNASNQLVLVMEDDSEITMTALEDLDTHDTDIKALLATIAAYIDTEVATILAAVDTEVAAIETKLDTPTNFMANVSALALEATLTAIKGGGWSTQTLVALKTAIDAIPTTAMRGTDDAATEAKQDIIDTAVDDILADTAALEIASAKQLFTMDFWSASLEEVSLDGDTAATVTLPTVTVADLPTNATITHAVVMFKFRMVENTHATVANKLDGATVAATSQVIQIDKSGATFIDAINFVDDQFGIAAATREGGDVIIGSIDVATEVDANDTYELRWLLALADEDLLNFNDVQMGIRIWYSV